MGKLLKVTAILAVGAVAGIVGVVVYARTKIAAMIDDPQTTEAELLAALAEMPATTYARAYIKPVPPTQD